MAAVDGEKIDVGGGEMHAVDRDEARPCRAEVMEPSERRHAEAL